MSAYTITLLEKNIIAENTLALQFKKPDDFAFIAGQHVIMKLINHHESTSNTTRLFTIASAPHEQNLMFATRLRSSFFKQVLKDMLPGSEVKITGPFGNFTMHTDENLPAVFLAGGIGITPFRSMLFHVFHEKSPVQLFLFYSNRRPEEAAFLDELLAFNSPSCTVIPTMTRPNDSNQPWNGETAYVSLYLLQKYIPDILLSHYYCAGPSTFVKAMKQFLEEANVDSEKLHLDEFPGY